MLTRRAVLTGTAAASIAAIASARGVEAAPKAPAGFGGCGFGNVEGGALASFQKTQHSFNAFMKWHHTAGEVFFKETSFGKVEVFFKFFQKGWSSQPSAVLQFLKTLDKAEAYFNKVEIDRAEFFIKGWDNASVMAKIAPGEGGGLQLEISECCETDIG